jgi:hypothetical protein
MADPEVVFFIVVIAVCVPMTAYMLPQDPTVARLIDGLHRRRQHRRLRRWVEQQRQEQRGCGR